MKFYYVFVGELALGTIGAATPDEAQYEARRKWQKSGIHQLITRVESWTTTITAARFTKTDKRRLLNPDGTLKDTDGTFVVHSASKLTSRHGSVGYPYSKCLEACNTMNKDYPDLVHWPGPIPGDSNTGEPNA